MIVLVALSLLLAPASLLAQPSLSVENLYDQKSRTPGVLIPFRLKSDTPGVSLLSASALPDNSVDCRAMRDPFLADMFLLKCKSESSVQLHIRFSYDGRLHTLNFGPVSVKSPDGLVLIPDDLSGGGDDPLALAGRQLFGTYCVSCHSSPQQMSGRTSTQIKDAVNTKGEMAFLKSILNSDDYTKLEVYLRNP